MTSGGIQLKEKSRVYSCIVQCLVAPVIEWLYLDVSHYKSRCVTRFVVCGGGGQNPQDIVLRGQERPEPAALPSLILREFFGFFCILEKIKPGYWKSRGTLWDKKIGNPKWRRIAVVQCCQYAKTYFCHVCLPVANIANKNTCLCLVGRWETQALVW